MKHLLEKKVLYLASEEKRTLLRLEAPAGFEVRNAFLTNVQSIQKLFSMVEILRKQQDYCREQKKKRMSRRLLQE